MSSVQNGTLHHKEDDDLCASQSKHDENHVSRMSSWTALPDLILILVPTGVLLSSGSKEGR